MCGSGGVAQSASGAKADAASGGKATISVEAKLVTLPVTVRDKKGLLVTNLGKSDFALQEDGRPQMVKFFNVDKDVPLTVGLLADTSGSMRGALDQERTAGKAFFEQMLATPVDKAFLLHFDHEVELLQDVTSSKEKLNAGLELLGPTRDDDPDSTDHHDTGPDGDNRNHARHGGTQIYDAIYLSSDELMNKQQGRKAIVVLSDGVDRGSKETLNEAIESAQRGETSVYTIYFKGEEGPRDGGFGSPGGHRSGGGYPGGGGGGWPGSGGGGRGGGGGQRGPEEPRVDGKKIMEQIAYETGGRFFEAKKKDSLDDIYKAIAEELRTQYVLGYTPDTDSTDTGFHKIALTVDRKDVFVQSRLGYYADR